ncbi:MAG TPA: FUSC family protein [Pyrinomonadaceae bacterium]|nr:FUSC family protein [Pyrinomonadaceae bacterium]
MKKLLKVEASGIRTALSAVLPLVVGQWLGYPAPGLLVGLGGLYLSITDKEGSTVTSLLMATVINGAAMLAGSLCGEHVWLSMFVTFAWAFVGGMMSVYGEVVAQIGFISTVTFAVALGLPAGLAASVERMGLFVAGGLWGVTLTLILWRFHQKTGEISEVPGFENESLSVSSASSGDAAGRGLFGRFALHLSFRSIIFRHALRLAVAATIAVGIFKFFKLERGYWVIITVLVIVKPVFVDTRKRALERVLGSVVGGAVAALLAASIHNIVVLDTLLLLFSVLAYSHVRENYGFYVLFLTPFVVLMIETTEPTDSRITLIRISNTLLGGAIAITVSYFLRPRSALNI